MAKEGELGEQVRAGTDTRVIKCTKVHQKV